MTRSTSFATAALASLGLSLTATGASAQAIYVDPYPAVVAPGYVVRQTLVTPPPIVRERTVVVTRPAYVPVPVLPLPRYGYAEEHYVVTDW